MRRRGRERRGGALPLSFFFFFCGVAAFRAFAGGFRPRPPRPGAWPDLSPPVPRDLFDSGAREHRFRPLLEDVGLVALARVVIAPLDQQPVDALLAGPAAHAHQMPEAVQLFALQLEIETALGEPLVR